MAFIRKRTTKAGVVSTALVESYRAGGKPRHRILANLHGAETLEVALGRLAAERDKLRKEREPLEAERPHAEQFYEMVTIATLDGRVWTAEQRKEIDGLLKKRKRLLKRVTEIDSRLAQIQKDGVTIKRHCAASKEAIQAEADRHAKHLGEIEALKVFDAFQRSGGNLDKFLKRQ